MTSRTGRPHLWLLIIHLLCSSSVTSILLNFQLQAPKTIWVDQSCISKGFTPATAQESLDIAGHGSRRLLNFADHYQAWVFKLLFKSEKDFSLLDNAETEAWNVVEVEGWISAMKYEVSRDIADVRIYCDNDARWRPVPDDEVQIARGWEPNSVRTPGDDQEFEDLVNFMRRDTQSKGCNESLTLGVTYDTMYPPNTGGVPDNYHSPRHTITICDRAFRSPVKQFAQIPFQAWRYMRMRYLNLIPTNVLLYQLVNLQPYKIRRNLGVDMSTEDTWQRMLLQPETELAQKPAPYVWNAVLAYAATIGWGVQEGLSFRAYVAGKELFRYTTALLHIQFVRGPPITLPDRMLLPAFINALGGT